MKAEMRALAHDLAKDSIVTDALAQFIAQVIEEIHKTKIAPAEARALAAETERDRLKVELVAEVVRREEANAYGDAEHDRALAAEAKCDALREAAVGAAAALAAAISVLERTPKAAKVAPSDRMFHQMLSDYRAALETARSALTKEPNND